MTGHTKLELKTTHGHLMPRSSICIMDLPALQTILLCMGMDSPAFGWVHVGTEMDLPAHRACWPTAIVAVVWPVSRCWHGQTIPLTRPLMRYNRLQSTEKYNATVWSMCVAHTMNSGSSSQRFWWLCAPQALILILFFRRLLDRPVGWGILYCCLCAKFFIVIETKKQDNFWWCWWAPAWSVLQCTVLSWLIDKESLAILPALRWHSVCPGIQTVSLGYWGWHFIQAQSFRLTAHC